MNTVPIITEGAICPLATVAARLARERAAEISREQGKPRFYRLNCRESAMAGYRLTVQAEEITIEAGTTREFMAGAGRLLELLRAGVAEGCGLAAGSWEEIPRYPVRLHYLPGHFGNSFEVAWPGEMRRYLEDLALWGASGYADWFDPNDMPDPYNPRVYCSSSTTLWLRKKEFLRMARELGLETALAITHNVGFTDQLRPEWEGRRDHRKRVQGQVLCPSNPEARRVCLQNHKNLFADLAEGGIHIDKLLYAPYDDGGCACDRCQPNYYPIFLSMVTEIHAIARRYFPAVKADICGWWATEAEMRQLQEFTRGPARDWFSDFMFSATYNVFALPDVRKTVGDLSLSTFFHIAFSHDNRDVYFKGGLHSAPRRIQSVIRSFAAQDCHGFNSYNEGFGDHYNEFLATRLARDPEADPVVLTRHYCRQMFALDGPDLEEMAGILLEMEMLEAAKAAGWLAALNRLRPKIKTPPRQAWAFEHVALKAELMELDHRIGSGENWRTRADLAPVLPLIRQRLERSEVLWRDVYGLGILRHIFTPANMMLPWYGWYLAVVPPPVSLIKPGSVLSQNA